MGLAPEGGKTRPALGKWNFDPGQPRDEWGRWTIDGGTGPAGSKLPQGVQVALDDTARTKSDAEGAAPPDKPTPPKGLTIVHGAPEDAVSLTAGDGTSFYAPPYANFCKVYAAGQANWQNPIAAFSAIGQFGTYDFQRDNGMFYSAYTNASNYGVGVYMAGAGYSHDATIAIAVAFASRFSSNAGAESQTAWWTKGWNDATNGVGPCSRPQHD